MAAEAPLAHRINEVHLRAPWSRTMTYKLVREGRLKARRLGGATLILEDDLRAFLTSLPESGGSQPPTSAEVPA